MNYFRFKLAILAIVFPFISLPGLAQIEPKIEPKLAQQPTGLSESRLRQHGTEIFLNGKTIAIPWAQWQVGNSLRLGISDTALTQQ